MSEVDETFARKFSGIIERKGLSVNRVADFFRIQPGQVTRWMNGVSSPVFSIQSTILDKLEELE